MQVNRLAAVACAAILAACGDAVESLPIFSIDTNGFDAGVLPVGGRDASSSGAAVGDAGVSSSASLGDSSLDNGGTSPGDGGTPAGNDDDASMSASGGDGDGAQGETGRMIGMTAAHNAVRAQVSTGSALPEITWSPTLAAYAQEWADTLAATSCASPRHRDAADLQNKGYGENLAAFGASGGWGGTPSEVSTAEQAVDGWAAEISCWTYGTIGGTERCDPGCAEALHSDGCGHYTQVVWRNSTEVGCGVATCNSGGYTRDIWICNYNPPGNYRGQAPY